MKIIEFYILYEYITTSHNNIDFYCITIIEILISIFYNLIQ